MTTVEAAYAMASIVAVFVLGFAGMGAVTAQVRCVDAAREVARLSAAGDPAAKTVGQRVAPDGASISVTRAGEYIEVTVSTAVALLPGLDVRARAVAALEPASAEQPTPRADASHR